VVVAGPLAAADLEGFVAVDRLALFGEQRVRHHEVVDARRGVGEIPNAWRVDCLAARSRLPRVGPPTGSVPKTTSPATRSP
jgi:hypothetical protein